MPRRHRVRLSTAEHSQLKQFARQNYPEYVPLGAIISELIEEKQGEK